MPGVRHSLHPGTAARPVALDDEELVHDAEKAIKVVLDAINRFPEVCQKPGPQAGIQEFGDSSVNIGYRYWIPTAKYFQLMTAVNLAIYKTLQQDGLTMPYPQMEVRMVKESV